MDNLQSSMKRILVIGSCGAGKSTFARRLHELTGLPLIPLDRFYWKPGWEEPSKEEWTTILEGLISKDEWIIDGNYGGSMEMRMKRADSVFWLDMPRSLCVYRVLKRIVITPKNGRQDMAYGCDERLDWDFIKYVWNFRYAKNPKIEARFDSWPLRRRMFRLTSRAQVSEMLTALQSDQEFNYELSSRQTHNQHR